MLSGQIIPTANGDATVGPRCLTLSGSLGSSCVRGFQIFVLRSALALIAIIALSACDSKRLPVLGPDDTILAFGDSLTHGTGVSQGDSYPTVLATLTNRSVVNAGVPGEISATGLSRLPAVLKEIRPSLMVLLHGGNDVLRNLDLSQTRNHLSAMITLAKDQGVEVVLVGVPQKSLFSDSAPIYSELAQQHGLVFLDDIIANLVRSPSKKSDSVHFNADGYRELAQAIYDRLKKAGAI